MWTYKQGRIQRVMAKIPRFNDKCWIHPKYFMIVLLVSMAAVLSPFLLPSNPVLFETPAYKLLFLAIIASHSILLVLILLYFVKGYGEMLAMFINGYRPSSPRMAVIAFLAVTTGFIVIVIMILLLIFMITAVIEITGSIILS